MRVRSFAVPTLVLIAGLVTTAVAAGFTWHASHSQQQLRLEAAAERARSALDARIEAYLAMLRGGAGLFAGSTDVTYDDFRAYVGRLEITTHYPGIQGIGYSAYLADGRREAVRQAMVAEGITDFHFWRLDDNGNPAPQPRGAPIHAILYLEPQNRPNRVALGFDMSSEVRRREAIVLARNTGRPAATGRVTLVQETDPNHTQAGFLVYIPLYDGPGVPAKLEDRQAKFDGTVYSAFRADDLLNGAVGADRLSEVLFEVYDGSMTPENLLHRSPEFAEMPSLMVSQQTAVAGRAWVLRFVPGPGFQRGHPYWLATLVGLSGAALTLALFVLMRGQVRAREMAERTADGLRRSEEALRAANREKDDFLAVVSHELRTPLNAIMGWASVLRRGDLPSERRERALAIIERNAASQARLVDDLLDTSRAIGGRLRLSPEAIDLGAIIDAVVESIRPNATAAGLSLHWQRPAGLGTISGDAPRLQQVITNLLSNAVKFTPAGGVVSVEAHRDRGTVIITVRDTGIGISPEFLPYVFDRFRQADTSSTRTYTGVGLGLSIVRSLVELHGGTVVARSEGRGRGSSFTVTLPTVAKAPAPPKPDAQEEQGEGLLKGN